MQSKEKQAERRPKRKQKELSQRHLFSVVIEKDKDGYFVYCPALQGCYSQGDSYEEAIQNIEDAIRLHIEDRLASGEEISDSESITVTALEVMV